MRGKSREEKRAEARPERVASNFASLLQDSQCSDRESEAFHSSLSLRTVLSAPDENATRALSFGDCKEWFNSPHPRATFFRDTWHADAQRSAVPDEAQCFWKAVGGISDDGSSDNGSSQSNTVTLRKRGLPA